MFIEYDRGEMKELFSCEEMSLTDNWGMVKFSILIEQEGILF